MKSVNERRIDADSTERSFFRRFVIERANALAPPVLLMRTTRMLIMKRKEYMKRFSLSATVSKNRYAAGCRDAKGEKFPAISEAAIMPSASEGFSFLIIKALINTINGGKRDNQV